MVRQALDYRRILMLLTACVAITLVTSALGDDLRHTDSHESLDDHPQPYLENFQAFFDGVDQYILVGEVTNCEELDGIPITFGGVFAGESTITAYDGHFVHIVRHVEAKGAIATAQAECHWGVFTDLMSIELF
jgi:hypothetical protein